MIHPHTPIDHSLITDETLQPYLPLPLNSLIGREEEINQICALLENAENRLVTISGEAGVGKTRVAKEVLARVKQSTGVAQRYLVIPEDATWEAIPPLALAAIATAVDSRPATIDELAAALGDTRVLLYINAIDRCVAAGTSLTELLQLLPTVTILVSSRIELHVRGERIVLLSTLPLPAVDATVAEAHEVESVQLLVDRIQGYDPTFRLTEQNVEHVIAICRHLEGLPLALELIAGRTRLFSVAEIHEQLPDALDLLADGPADLPPRNRSIRATIRWTYDTLAAPQQRALRALSIFHHSFCLPMGLGLQTQNPELADSREAALNQLSLLVSAGMVSPIPSGVGEDPARYRIRWDIQGLCVEQLHATGEYNQVVADLLHAHIQLTLPLLQQVHTAPELTLYRDLDLEIEDIHLALNHAALDTTMVREALPLASAMWQYWTARGRAADGEQILKQLMHAHGYEESREYAHALHALGVLSMELQRDSDAQSLFEQAARLREKLNDTAGLAATYNNLGVLYMHFDNTARAEQYYRRSIALRKDDANSRFTVISLCNVGELRMMADDIETARELFAQAFEIARQVDLPALAAECAGHLTIVAYRNGDESSAYDWYGVGIAMAERAADAQRIGRLRMLRGYHLHLAGRDREGILEAIEGLKALGNGGSIRGMHEAAVPLASIAVRHGQHRFAAQCLGAAETSYSGMNNMIGRHAAAPKAELEAIIRGEIGGTTYVRQLVVGSRLPVESTLEAGIGVLHTIAEELQEASDPQGPTTPLTPRELEVLACVARGLSDKQIAEELAISPRTSMTHMSNIMAKLNVKNRSAAASTGARLGLIPPINPLPHQR